MATSLNIKNADVYRLARELADRTGETLTQAVEIALRERLEGQRRSPKEGLAVRLRELAGRTAPLMKDLPPSDKVGDLLYGGETGLPL